LDDDGDIDMLHAESFSSFSNSLAWYQNNGNGTFTRRSIATAPNGVRSIAVADVDADGRLDFIVASELDDSVNVYRGNGAAVPTFTATKVTNTADGALSVRAGDLDNDGDLDLVVASDGNNQVVVYRNLQLLAGDFDENGYVDGADFLAWQRGLGVFPNASLAEGDADRDGDVDRQDILDWSATFGFRASADVSPTLLGGSFPAFAAVASEDIETEMRAAPRIRQLIAVTTPSLSAVPRRSGESSVDLFVRSNHFDRFVPANVRAATHERLEPNFTGALRLSVRRTERDLGSCRLEEVDAALTSLFEFGEL
jgi:hypothetical protein